MSIEINRPSDISLTVSESKSSETVIEIPKETIAVSTDVIGSIEAARSPEVPSIVEVFTGPKGTPGPPGPVGQPGQPGTDGVDGQGIFFSDIPLTGMTQPYLRIGLDENGDYTLFLGVPDA